MGMGSLQRAQRVLAKKLAEAGPGKRPSPRCGKSRESRPGGTGDEVSCLTGGRLAPASEGGSTVYGASAASNAMANAVSLEELSERPEPFWLRVTWPMELRS